MATTAAGTALTAQQRRDQLAIRAAAVRELTEAWPLLDPARLDATFPAWVRLMLDLVARHRARSADSGGDYYTALRVAELGDARPPALRIASAPNVDAVTTSLLVTGPVGMKARVGRGVPLAQAEKQGLVDVSGAVARHVLDGGRDTVRQSFDRDSRGQRLARITDGDPCWFCAMLATRGFVYHSVESAGAGATRYHDHCGCTAEPDFHGAPLPESSQPFDDLYREVTGGESGRGKATAFRRAYEARAAA